jgi:hypothetical protein
VVKVMSEETLSGAVRAVVHTLDPGGLIAIGAPEDEYDEVIFAIASHLSGSFTAKQASDVMQEVVRSLLGPVRVPKSSFDWAGAKLYSMVNLRSPEQLTYEPKISISRSAVFRSVQEYDWLKELLAAMPEPRRLVRTSHDLMVFLRGYEYALQLIGLAPAGDSFATGFGQWLNDTRGRQLTTTWDQFLLEQAGGDESTALKLFVELAHQYLLSDDR